MAHHRSPCRTVRATSRPGANPGPAALPVVLVAGLLLLAALYVIHGFLKHQKAQDTCDLDGFRQTHYCLTH